VQILVERLCRPSAAMPAKFVPDPVQHRASEIRLQGALAANLDMIEVPKRTDDGFLDQVFGVGQIARAAGKPPARPAGEQGKVPPEQAVKGKLVTIPNPLDEEKSGFQFGRHECGSPVAKSYPEGVGDETGNTTASVYDDQAT
jgi:hypothetical protein